MSSHNVNAFSAFDYQCMARAIQIAKKGRYTTSPNPCVGCVIVKDGIILSEGWHQKAGEPHAEIHALRQLNSEQQYHSTAYVTLEPCSHTGQTGPCADALIDAKVARVVIANIDANPSVHTTGISKLREHGIIVDVGLLDSQARQINEGFFHRFEKQRPFITVKMAASFDGATAMKSGESQWITGVDARKDVHLQRAASCAILSTAKTVMTDNAKLNVRLDSPSSLEFIEDDALLAFNQYRRIPLRVVIDKNLDLLNDSNVHKLSIFQQTGEICLACLPAVYDAKQDQIKQINESSDIKANLTLLAVPEMKEQTNKLNLENLFQLLALKQINHVWVEAGATLSGQLLSLSLVDKVILYLAPMFCGENTQRLFADTNFTALAQSKRFTLSDQRQIGDDMRFIFDKT